MIRFFIALWGLFLSFADVAYSSQNKLDYYHDFWSPRYHGELLSNCFYHKSICGIEVANQYCKVMGYKKAIKALVTNNVGLANYIDGCPNCKKYQCKGWDCNGFKVIRCVDSVEHAPGYSYHYRQRNFVLPRLDNFRLDWCYEDGKGCGKKVANSFCRIMGYTESHDYKLDNKVYASREIGNGKLCFGKNCRGFSYINCYR